MGAAMCAALGGVVLSITAKGVVGSVVVVAQRRHMRIDNDF